MGDGGATAVAGVLRNNTRVTRLNLAGDVTFGCLIDVCVGNGVGVGGARAVCEALGYNTALRELFRSDRVPWVECLTSPLVEVRACAAADAAVLAFALARNSVLTSLIVHGGQGTNGAKAVAEGLAATSALTVLELQGMWAPRAA